MARKSVGYVELQWTCPNCGTRNPGSQRICQNCGTPQPDDVEFEQPLQTELIKDEAELAEAKAAPDIHCYYCGTRNPASATHCSQCGADLREGAVRKTGRVIGAHRVGPAQPIICPNCSRENPPDAPNCLNCGASLGQPRPEPVVRPQTKPARAGKAGLFGGIGLVAIVVIFCAIIGLFVFLTSRTESLSGRVQDVRWERAIAVEALVPVTREAWRVDIPAGVAVNICRPRVHHVQDIPAPNAEEVCGTPYVVDQGSGFGEVVQDCQYRVYEDFCEYEVEEWRQVDTETLTGNNFSAQWPSLALSPGERAGAREETYVIVFATEDGPVTYRTNDPAEFAQFQPGSTWNLEVNSFNSVTSIAPGN